jgi:hypothetical protein
VRNVENNCREQATTARQGTFQPSPDAIQIHLSGTGSGCGVAFVFHPTSCLHTLHVVAPPPRCTNICKQTDFEELPVDEEIDLEAEDDESE